MADISIVVVAADPIMQKLLKDLVAAAEDLRLVAAVQDAAAAISRARDQKPDVILLDLDLPGSTGYNGQAGQQLLRQLSLVTCAPILCIGSATQPGSPEMAAAYDDGAALVVGKSSGILSLDLTECRGKDILDGLRVLAGDVS